MLAQKKKMFLRFVSQIKLFCKLLVWTTVLKAGRLFNFLWACTGPCNLFLQPPLPASQRDIFQTSFCKRTVREPWQCPSPNMPSPIKGAKPTVSGQNGEWSTSPSRAFPRGVQSQPCPGHPGQMTRSVIVWAGVQWYPFISWVLAQSKF